MHKSDVDNLARSIKSVLQSSSKMVVELKNQKLSATQNITSMSGSEAIRQTLSDQLVEVKSWKDQLGRSSYEHAGFKGEKLDSLAKKIESDINSLRRAEVSCVKKDLFLARLSEVKNQGAVEGFKLDQNHEGKFGRVPK